MHTSYRTLYIIISNHVYFFQRTRPTTYFLARFRPSPDAGFIEVDYRLNKATGKESFQCTSGSLENLLTGEDLAKYQVDKENNNVDEKVVFFKNFPRIFNNFEGRIWWNGFIVCVDEKLSSRMRLKTVVPHPPAFI